MIFYDILEDPMIEQTLKSIGLSYHEVDVYLYVLEHDNSIVSIIAKRLNLMRPTVYQCLDSLCEKGLVTSVVLNRVKHFSIENTESVLAYWDQKIEESRKIRGRVALMKKQLDDIQKQSSAVSQLPSNKSIHYYVGAEAVCDFIDETLESDEKDQVCFGLNEQPGSDSRWIRYTKKRVSQKMTVKSIQPNTKAARMYKNRDADELRKTYLVPKDAFPATCEIDIVGDVVAMFSQHGKIPMGIKIQNKKMADTLRSLFHLAWERAEQYDKKIG